MDLIGCSVTVIIGEFNRQGVLLCDFRLLPRGRWDVPSSGILWKISWPLNMGPRGCPKTMVRIYHCTLC